MTNDSNGHDLQQDKDENDKENATVRNEDGHEIVDETNQSASRVATWKERRSTKKKRVGTVRQDVKDVRASKPRPSRPKSSRLSSSASLSTFSSSSSSVQETEDGSSSLRKIRSQHPSVRLHRQTLSRRRVARSKSKLFTSQSSRGRAVEEGVRKEDEGEEERHYLTDDDKSRSSSSSLQELEEGSSYLRKVRSQHPSVRLHRRTRALNRRGERSSKMSFARRSSHGAAVDECQEDDEEAGEDNSDDDEEEEDDDDDDDDDDDHNDSDEDDDDSDDDDDDDSDEDNEEEEDFEYQVEAAVVDEEGNDRRGNDIVLQGVRNSGNSDSSSSPFPIVAEVDPDAIDVKVVDPAAERRQRRRMWYLLAAFALLVLVAAVLSVAFFLTNSSSDPKAATAVPTQAPTPVPTPEPSTLEPTSYSMDDFIESIREDGYTESSRLDDPQSIESLVLLLMRTYIKDTGVTDRRVLRQKYAVAMLYAHLRGVVWKYSGDFVPKLDFNVNECDWPMLFCNSEGFVEVIDIMRDDGGKVATGLEGAIASEIAYLTSLKRIRVNNELISGVLPSSLGVLSNLESLDLSGGEIHRVPFDALARLPKLEILRLDRHKIDGTFPMSMYNLTQLKDLRIGSNLFEGTIDTAIGNLASLQTFEAFNNSLTGTLPTQVGLLENLVELDLHRNLLNGTVPASELAALRSLTSVNLQMNDFDGVMEECGGAPFLEGLVLDCDKVKCACCTVEDGQCG